MKNKKNSFMVKGVAKLICHTFFSTYKATNANKYVPIGRFLDF